MAVARKIAYNVIFSSVAKVISTVLALVVIGIITRSLGKEGFGNYATVLAVLAFFAALADLGLNQISVREISKTGADEKKIIGNVFTLRIFSALAIIIISPLLIWILDYPAEVERGILIVAFSFLFSSTYQILNGIFQKNLAMDKVALSELMGKIIQVVFVALAFKWKLGFDWIMAALLFNSLASFILVFFWSRKYIHFCLQIDLAYWKIFLKESFPLGISAVITFAYFKMDTLILSYLKSSAEVGVYNVAYKVLENITFFPAMIIGLVTPILAKNIFDNREEFKKIADKTFRVFIILVIPLLVGTLFLADDVVRVIGGNGFSESAGVLRILVFSLALIFFGNFFNAILIVGNLQKKLLWVFLLAAATSISLNLIFVPRFSYLASAFASLTTEAVVVILGAYLTFSKIKYRPASDRFFRVLGAGILMGLFLWVFRSYNFILLALGSSMVYFLFLWLFKGVQKEELQGLISKKGVEEYEQST